MQYTLVYRDDPQGFNWTVMNTHGLYAAVEWTGGRKSIRRWRNSDGANDYMTEHRHRRPPEDLVWEPWPTEKPIPIKPVTTAASYKPAHGGYPERTAEKAAKLAESYGGTYTGRFRSSVGHIEKEAASAPLMTLGELLRRKLEQQQPLVWPVIPQIDDGSNEEATTVPDSLVQLMAYRVFIVRLRNALTK